MCFIIFKRISNLFLIAFLWTVLANGAQGKCVLNIDKHNPPLLTKNFGSKSVILSQSTSGVINLDDYDQLGAYCGSGFTVSRIIDRGYRVDDEISDTNEEKTQNLQCRPNGLLLVNRDPDINFNDGTIGCRDGVYSIFETHENLTNCEKYQSYAVGAKLDTPIINAAFCYDLESTELKYVTFKLTEISPILEKAKNSYPIGLNKLSLMEPLNRIDRIFQFPSDEDVSASIEKHVLGNYWLRIAIYELRNIVQTSYNSESFNSFSDFFRIIWWRNLRDGNWRQFTELMEKRAKTVTYNLFVGTSGTVRVPVVNECLGEKTLEINYHGKKKAVPEFIWAYMQPTNESVTDEFVAIGYNSPYFENFPKNTTIICKDMCDEIDWLKPMVISRSISTFGVMYCCRVEDVIGLLDGFPLKETNGTPRIDETTVTP